MGWIGHREQLLHTLGVFGCDRDPEGNFLVSGQIVSFLGLGKEFVVGDDAVAYVGGKPVSIAGMLGSTSYGMKVRVI
jgi:hypothetical protein